MPDTVEAVNGRVGALGGCGKDAMLIVRRSVFSGLPGARPLEAERTALRFEVELEVERGERAADGGLGLEGARSLESCGDAARDKSGEPGADNVDPTALFLAFGFGRVGSALVGGGFVAAREGVGRAEVDAMADSNRLREGAGRGCNTRQYRGKCSPDQFRLCERRRNSHAWPGIVLDCVGSEEPRVATANLKAFAISHWTLDAV